MKLNPKTLARLYVQFCNASRCDTITEKEFLCDVFIDILRDKQFQPDDFTGAFVLTEGEANAIVRCLISLSDIAAEHGRGATQHLAEMGIAMLKERIDNAKQLEANEK